MKHQIVGVNSAYSALQQGFGRFSVVYCMDIAAHAAVLRDDGVGRPPQPAPHGHAFDAVFPAEGQPLAEGLLGAVEALGVERIDVMREMPEMIDHPGGVAVVAIDENDNVLTVKQYRYAFQTVLEEIPAGKLERGEDPAAAARRELSEETGASCETLTPLGEILASPGGFTEVLHLYMATGLTFGSQHPDEDEFINFERVPFDALLDRCLSGDLRDGKTVAGVLKVYALRTRKKEEK